MGHHSRRALRQLEIASIRGKTIFIAGNEYNHEFLKDCLVSDGANVLFPSTTSIGRDGMTHPQEKQVGEEILALSPPPDAVVVSYPDNPDKEAQTQRPLEVFSKKLRFFDRPIVALTPPDLNIPDYMGLRENGMQPVSDQTKNYKLADIIAQSIADHFSQPSVRRV